MPGIINLENKFNEWFNENEGYSPRSERFYLSMNAFSTNEASAINLTEWLESAFIAGAKVAAQDSCDTLLDYATVVAGIDEPKRNPSEAFDNSSANLLCYWTQVFNKE